MRNDKVKVGVGCFCRDANLVAFCEGQVKDNFSRIVDEDSERFFSEHDEKVVRAVKAFYAFVLYRLVTVDAFKNVAALVDAAHRLAKSKNLVVFFESAFPTKSAVFLGGGAKGRLSF